MIDMKYGRKDAVKPEDCVDEGNLPAGNKPFPDADNAQVSFPFLPVSLHPVGSLSWTDEG